MNSRKFDICHISITDDEFLLIIRSYNSVFCLQIRESRVLNSVLTLPTLFLSVLIECFFLDISYIHDYTESSDVYALSLLRLSVGLVIRKNEENGCVLFHSLEAEYLHHACGDIHVCRSFFRGHSVNLQSFDPTFLPLLNLGI